MIRVVAVVGPTAAGKSDLAVALAQRAGGEIVNADSMQLYAGMDIGTAKLPESERGGIEHHLLDVWPISKSAAVAEYQAMARASIAEITARGRLPIIVGGSGLYLRGALDRLEGFASRFGAEVYGLPLNERKVTLVEEPWKVADALPYIDGDVLVPMRAGDTVAWRLAR